MDSILNTLEERFAFALHNTARAWRCALDKRLKHLGLSQASWTTFAVVYKAQQPLSQVELANRVGIEAATMVATIDRLVKAGFLRRESAAHDRRVKLVVLTDSGKQLVDKVMTEANKFRDELLVGVDKRQLLAATEWLEHLQSMAEAVT
ncbi:MAG: MarR family winged helix-turn-helix transcriptional regulator [Burkholderiales bacterium]